MASTKTDLLLTPSPPQPDSAQLATHAALTRFDVQAHRDTTTLRKAILQNLQIYGCSEGVSSRAADTSGTVSPGLARILTPLLRPSVASESSVTPQSSPTTKTTPVSPLTRRSDLPRVNLLSSLFPESGSGGSSESKEASEESEAHAEAETTVSATVQKQQHLDAKRRYTSTQVIRDVSFVQATFPLSTAATALKFHSGSESLPLDHIHQLPLPDIISLHVSIVSSATAAIVMRAIVMAGNPPPHVRKIFATIRSLDMFLSRRIALADAPSDMQLADIIATNSRLGYFTLQALLDTHSYNRDPSAELAAATSAFTIRVTGNRLTFTGLESLQLLLAESHSHASLDLRLTFNKVVQQIVHVSSFSFVHPGYNWPEWGWASSIVSSHMGHGLQSITYAQLVDLLDMLQSFDSVFCSIQSAYADHSNVHTAALTTHAPPMPLEAQMAALTALVTKLAAAPAAAPTRPPRYGRGGSGKMVSLI